MKGVLSFFTILLLITFLFSSCQKELDGPAVELKAKPTAGLIGMPVVGTSCPGTEVIDLFAGQNMPAGSVSYSVENNMLTLCAASTCALSEQHIFVGLEEDLPTSGNGGLIPGRFAYSDGGENDAWVFDLTSIAVPGVDYCFVIAYHAVGCGETIWGFGFERGKKGNWSSYTTVCVDNADQ